MPFLIPAYHAVLHTGMSAGIGGLALVSPSIWGSLRNLSDTSVSNALGRVIK